MLSLYIGGLYLQVVFRAGLPVYRKQRMPVYEMYWQVSCVALFNFMQFMSFCLSLLFSPFYVHPDSDMDVVARRLLWGRFVNAGQTCIAPDYVMCTKEVEVSRWLKNQEGGGWRFMFAGQWSVL